MFLISKEFTFSASHQLDYLSPEHQCARLHGHNYVVVLELACDSLNKDSFVRDYTELSLFKKYLDETFDHRHLNDILGNSHTTAEVLAKFFYDWCLKYWPEMIAVKVSETPKTWAEYRPVKPVG